MTKMVFTKRFFPHSFFPKTFVSSASENEILIPSSFFLKKKGCSKEQVPAKQ